jgi:hypothetical protein
MIPQILVIVLFVMSLSINLVKNGEQRHDKYSVGWTFVGTLIMSGLLYWGGFFNVFFK